MDYLFKFGISQDDARIEQEALGLEKGDRLVCIASAGEVPLNLLALSEATIDAVDVSLPQIHLSRLKMFAAIHLEPVEAAKFIGYTHCSVDDRIRFYKYVSQFMNPAEREFWETNPAIIQKGPIRTARFENYLSKFNWVGLLLLNRKKLMKLFEFDDVESQRNYFDRSLASKKLRWIFKIAFHPKIYKNRGIDQQGLLYSGQRDIAQFFYSRFRDFCTSTLARTNYFFQFLLFGHILFESALPEYLQRGQIIRERSHQISFSNNSISSQIRSKPKGQYSKFALSNVGDWLPYESFIELLRIISQQSSEKGKLLLRYIHFAYSVPEDLKQSIQIDQEFGQQLVSHDRCPFYSLLPMRIND